MIRILVERNATGQVERVLVKGHANFAEEGKDLVCAAVSGISIGMVNAIETMFGVQIHADDDGDGKVDCHLPRDVHDPETREKIHLLLEAMVVSLKNMADEFPKYVTIQERNRK
ncbi:ribosomal-processing cysteine protease Prp [Laceyella putida]|uniref:Ribosomal processing cysteine protease Prp n=1 Tax=Laceyella putida TaxID=110101 RepID=A0ABW2RIV7_9BACL